MLTDLDKHEFRHMFAEQISKMFHNVWNNHGHILHSSPTNQSLKLLSKKTVFMCYIFF